MTVSSTLNKISYRGNGIVKEFAIPFRFFENTEIKVYMVSAVLPETLLILGDDYTVSGADSENGGAVLMNVAPEEDECLTIVRVVPMTQEVDYRENEIFPAETQERALDKLTMMVQQNAEKLNRTLTLGVTSSEKPDEIIPLIFNAQTESANSAVLAAKCAETAVSSASQALSGAARAEEYARGVSFGNIGDVKWSMRSDCPMGAAWCDGTEYGKAAFPQVFDMLVCGDLPSVSYEAYAAELEAHHGNCGKFALDAVNRKFRVPLFKSVYMGATPDFINVGEYEQDQIVNMTGITSMTAWPYIAGLDKGSVYQKKVAAGLTIHAGNGTAGTDTSKYYAEMDVSREVNTGDRVQPETVLMRAYIVMYTAAVEASVAQAAELMTALSGKVNADLSNLSEEKDIIIEFFPTYQDILDGTADGKSWYKKYKSGWIEQGGTIQQGSDAVIDVNLIIPFKTVCYDVSYMSYALNAYNVASWWFMSIAPKTQTVFSACQLNFNRRWYACGY